MSKKLTKKKAPKKTEKIDKKMRHLCHDCKEEIKGAAYVYNIGGEEYEKCNKCFAKNTTLEDFQKCQVYSRVVGYFAPVSQWNEGKSEEMKDRKVFKSEEKC